MRLKFKLRPGQDKYIKTVQNEEQANPDNEFSYFVFGLTKNFYISHGSPDGTFLDQQSITSLMLANKNVYLICCYPLTVKKALYETGYQELSKRVIVPFKDNLINDPRFTDDEVVVFYKNDVLYVEASSDCMMMGYREIK
jgi:hypothetical protein